MVVTMFGILYKRLKKNPGRTVGGMAKVWEKIGHSGKVKRGRIAGNDRLATDD